MPDELQDTNENAVPQDAVGVETDLAQADAARAAAREAAARDAAERDPFALLKAGWRDAWQAPTLLVGGGVLLLGLALAISSSPDPDMAPVITRANRLIENEDYEQAIELLNTEVYPWIGAGDAPRGDRIAYHLAKARSIYYGQRRIGLDDERNHVSVIREYLAAEREGGVLEPRDMAALANTYIARGEIGLAVQRAREIPESKRYLRDAVYRGAVASLLDRSDPQTEHALDLLAEVLVDPRLPIEHRVWALEKQGQVRLEQGYADETVTRILRAMPRLDDAGPSQRSRLHLILGEAYVQLGATAQAREQVEMAQELSGAADEHYPKVLLMKAMVEDAQGRGRQASDLYAEIVSNYSSSSAFPLALLGLGETRAELDEPELSLEAYADLVGGYDGFGIESYPSRTQVLESLLARADESLSAGRPMESIEYARLADTLYKDLETPSAIYAASAWAHQAAAEQMLGEPVAQVATLMGLDPSTRAEVQRHLIAAATNFALHAERHVVTSLPVYADSLWRSADLFDRAGDQGEAIRAFRTYADSMPSDPRHAEALFRLAESLRALGDFQASAVVYEGLIDAKDTTAGADIGALADASHVPLAQAYLYDENTENDAKAEELLIKSLDGSMGSTDTRLFRDALLELAGLYDRTGRPERAIERYEEFSKRYPGDPETGSLVFRLGDAYRRLADQIEATLDEAMPASGRNRRRGEIAEHRHQAMKNYRSAIELLGEQPQHSLGIYESIALRNAHFYLGDCAYDLGEYHQAIGYYDRARDRYVDDPASLVAMVQIVNAYIATGQFGRARTANERAKRFYQSMPDAAWDDPTLPMDRDDWERWLASSAILLARGEP